MITRLRLLLILIAFWNFNLLPIISMRWIDPFTTPIQLYRFITGDLKAGTFSNWVDLEDLPYSIRQATLAAEDQKFNTHHGFDFEQIKSALSDKEKKSKKQIRGASTLSQQVAKNLFLWPGRSWLRKGLEVYFTFWIELFWPKKRIVEVYLNIAEWGPNVYGIQAGAKYHFKKSAQKLTQWESASLAVILPNPKKRNPHRLTEKLSQKRNRILKQMGAMPTYSK